MRAFEKPIDCTIFGCRQNRIEGITIRHGNDYYKPNTEVIAKHKGDLSASVAMGKHAYALRRIFVVKDYCGECGHKWQTELFTHEGKFQVVITSSMIDEKWD